MQIEIKGLDSVYKELKELKLMEFKAVSILTKSVYEKARKRGSTHGSLGDAVKFRIKKSPKSAGKVFLSDRGKLVDWRGQKWNYGFFVHFGTKPHVIKPKNKKALRWVGGDNFIFAKKVNHPGYKGDPFLYIAAKESFSRFNSLVDKFVKG